MTRPTYADTPTAADWMRSRRDRPSLTEIPRPHHRAPTSGNCVAIVHVLHAMIAGHGTGWGIVRTHRRVRALDWAGGTAETPEAAASLDYLLRSGRIFLERDPGFEQA